MPARACSVLDHCANMILQKLSLMCRAIIPHPICGATVPLCPAAYTTRCFGERHCDFQAIYFQPSLSWDAATKCQKIESPHLVFSLSLFFLPLFLFALVFHFIPLSLPLCFLFFLFFFILFFRKKKVQKVKFGSESCLSDLHDPALSQD